MTGKRLGDNPRDNVLLRARALGCAYANYQHDKNKPGGSKDGRALQWRLFVEALDHALRKESADGMETQRMDDFMRKRPLPIGWLLFVAVACALGACAGWAWL